MLNFVVVPYFILLVTVISIRGTDISRIGKEVVLHCSLTTARDNARDEKENS